MEAHLIPKNFRSEVYNGKEQLRQEYIEKQKLLKNNLKNSYTLFYGYDTSSKPAMKITQDIIEIGGEIISKTPSDEALFEKFGIKVGTMLEQKESFISSAFKKLKKALTFL